MLYCCLTAFCRSEHVAFIGKGLFGKVTKVWNKVNNKFYAMKELNVSVPVNVLFCSS